MYLLNSSAKFKRYLIKYIVPVILLSNILSGCITEAKDQELLTGLNEVTANSIIMTLGNNSIDTDKLLDKNGSYTILVSKSQRLNALNILNQSGQPAQKFTNFGEVFKKDGFISSPLEEHSRFLYALSQEVANLLAGINGVVEVRVVVNVPQPNDTLWQAELPRTSASVLIKHYQGARVDLYVSRIKNLVSNAIPGLTPDKVEVVMSLQKDN